MSTFRSIPATAIKTPSSIKQATLCLLRALLRESTYLPDELSREYFRAYTLSRFKKYRSEASNTKDFISHTPSDQKRRKELWARGRKWLRVLQRANEGETPALLSVLFHTYGRRGKRRYALLEPILQPDGNSQGDAAAESTNPEYLEIPPALRRTKLDSNEICYEIDPRYGRLSSLVAAHKAHTWLHATAEPARIRQKGAFAPRLPALNIWKRPLPAKRHKNLVRKKYAELLDVLLPPLPDEEWDRLKKFVWGEERWKGCKARRIVLETPVISAFGRDEFRGLSVLKFTRRDVDTFIRTEQAARGATEKTEDKAMKQAHMLESAGHGNKSNAKKTNPASGKEMRQTILEDVLELQTLPKKKIKGHKAHVLTPRSMRRIYAIVFAQCPRMDLDSTTGKWKVTWGSGPPMHRKVSSSNTFTEHAKSTLFSGLNSPDDILPTNIVNQAE